MREMLGAEYFKVRKKKKHSHPNKENTKKTQFCSDVERSIDSPPFFDFVKKEKKTFSLEINT